MTNTAPAPSRGPGPPTEGNARMDTPQPAEETQPMDDAEALDYATTMAAALGHAPLLTRVPGPLGRGSTHPEARALATVAALTDFHQELRAAVLEFTTDELQAAQDSQDAAALSEARHDARRALSYAAWVNRQYPPVPTFSWADYARDKAAGEA